MHIERFGKSGICFFKPLSILEVDASISLREIREITSILQPSAAIWVVFLFHFYDIPWPFPVWRVLMRALQVRRLKSLQEIHRSKNLAPDGCPDRTCWSLWSMPLRVFCCGLPILRPVWQHIGRSSSLSTQDAALLLWADAVEFWSRQCSSLSREKGWSFRSYKVGVWLCHSQLDSSHVGLTGNEHSRWRGLQVWSDTRPSLRRWNLVFRACMLPIAAVSRCFLLDADTHRFTAGSLGAIL